MTSFLTRDCSCTHRTYNGQKRPEECIHGNRYLTEAEVKPKVRPPLKPKSDRRQAEEESGARPKQRKYTKRSQPPTRDWTDARAKVEEEGCCRICKRSGRKLEAAHILGREHDGPKIGAGGKPLKELHVDPDRIVPLCGPFPEGCHGEVHANQVNLVHHLTMPEQLQAVEDAGGIAPAWVALTRVEHRERVQAAAVVPADFYPSPTNKGSVAAPETEHV
jgi:hypothetical protein